MLSKFHVCSEAQRLAVVRSDEILRSTPAARCRWKSCHFLTHFPVHFLSPEEVSQRACCCVTSDTVAKVAHQIGRMWWLMEAKTTHNWWVPSQSCTYTIVKAWLCSRDWRAYLTKGNENVYESIEGQGIACCHRGHKTQRIQHMAHAVFCCCHDSSEGLLCSAVNLKSSRSCVNADKQHIRPMTKWRWRTSWIVFFINFQQLDAASPVWRWPCRYWRFVTRFTLDTYYWPFKT